MLVSQRMEIAEIEKSKCHYSVLQVFLLLLIISHLQISSERVVLDLFTRYASMSTFVVVYAVNH
jgi:hypothetical protein